MKMYDFILVRGEGQTISMYRIETGWVELINPKPLVYELHDYEPKELTDLMKMNGQTVNFSLPPRKLLESMVEEPYSLIPELDLAVIP